VGLCFQAAIFAVAGRVLFMNRRSFLSALGASAFAADGWAKAPATTARTISIIHTTDLHGHILPTATYDGLQNVGGLARCATLIRQWRKENPHHLLIDVGDLYQGTDVGRRSSGQVMVKLINKLGYDAWVLGNHDFDWGRDIVESAIGKSAMPVLAGNIRFSGKAPGEHEKGSWLARLAPHLIREVGGFKIGIIGTVTPGLASWLHPRILREIEAVDPIDPVQNSIRELRAAGAHAILVAGHMGFKGPGFYRDDFANRVSDITKSCRGVDLFIGAHTHKDLPTVHINSVPYTQANYFGIHLGRADLTFEIESGKLLERRVFTVLMDDRYETDPAVLSLAQNELELSRQELARPIGTVTGTLAARSSPGQPSDQQLLIGLAIRDALARQNVTIDAVMHGSFSADNIEAGEKTVADVWEFMPYENFVVTAELTVEQLTAVMNEAFGDERTGRNLIGFAVKTAGDNGRRRVTEILDGAGNPLTEGKRFRIAMNSYDAQSGGQRLPSLREIVASSDANAQFHEIETRDAVIEFFLHRKSISRETLAS
jgi:2',3'-cyclic-nucleotide 2'-phosphodiesterase (5'-nucleotidase family)